MRRSVDACSFVTLGAGLAPGRRAQLAWSWLFVERRVPCATALGQVPKQGDELPL